MAPARSSFLDRPVARLAALGVFGLCVAALVYIHRDDIRPRPTGEVRAAADDPAAPCIAERYAEIEAMAGEGVISPEQERLFKSRAEALCRAREAGEAGSGLGAPPGAAAVRPPDSPGRGGGGPGLPSPEALKPAAPGGGAGSPPPGAVRPPGG